MHQEAGAKIVHLAPNTTSLFALIAAAVRVDALVTLGSPKVVSKQDQVRSVT